MDEPKVRRVLSGSWSSNTCAFCAYHGKALTPNQMKSHRCLGKQCTALIRHEHPIWQEREKRKAKRKARKQRLEETYKRSTGGEAHAVHTEKASADRGGVSGVA